MRAIDVSGQTFGELIVVEQTRNKNGLCAWLCQCSCGGTVVYTTSQLVRGHVKTCAQEGHDDLTGKTFGRLLVTSRSYLKKTRTYYNCRCECGKETLVAGSKLKNGHTQSCGCYRDEKTVERNHRFRKTYGEAARNRVIDTYRRNANRKGVTFELSIEQTIALLKGDCHYCGRPPSTVSSSPKMYGEYTHNGIDRKINGLGYIEGNCVSCCTECNYRKAAQDYGDFLAWVKRVAQHLGLCGEIIKL